MDQLSALEAYWDARPCNIRHSPAEVGTREYFEEVTQRRYLVEPHIRAFADFPRWKGKRVLELGCGIGTDAASFVEAGAFYGGVELSKESATIAHRRLREYYPGRYWTVTVANAEKLCYSHTGQYDLVYCWGVLHHTPNPERVIEHVKKYMHRESEFRCMVYATNSWKRAMIDAGLDQYEAQAGCPIARTYTKDELAELLSDFEIIDMHQDHIFPYVVEDYVRYKYTVQPWFDAMPPPMFRALELNFGWHLMARCKLK